MAHPTIRGERGEMGLKVLVPIGLLVLGVVVCFDHVMAYIEAEKARSIAGDLAEVAVTRQDSEGELRSALEQALQAEGIDVYEHSFDLEYNYDSTKVKVAFEYDRSISYLFSSTNKTFTVEAHAGMSMANKAVGGLGDN